MSEAKETKNVIMMWIKRIVAVTTLLGVFVGSFLWVNGISESAVAASIKQDVQVEIRKLDDQFVREKRFQEFKENQIKMYDTINKTLDRIEKEQSKKIENIEKNVGKIMNHLIDKNGE